MLITLHIIFPPNTTPNLTIQLDDRLLVNHARKIVWEKANFVEFGKRRFFHFTQKRFFSADYGLILCCERRWLDSDRTLASYNLPDGVTLAYRRKISHVKVRLPNKRLDVKTIELDQSLPLKQLLHIICRKFDIVDYDNYDLARTQASEPIFTVDNLEKLQTEWLDRSATLLNEEIHEEEVLVLKQRIGPTKGLSVLRPGQRNRLYNELCDTVQNGNGPPLTCQQSAELTALQAQADFGNLADLEREGGVRLPFLSAEYATAEVGSRDKMVYDAWKKQHGMDGDMAKFSYIKLLQSYKTYEATFFTVKEKNKSGRMVKRMFGIGPKYVTVLDIDTKQITDVWSLAGVKHWTLSPNTFVVDFDGGDWDCLQLITTEGEQMYGLLEGYVDLFKKQQARESDPTTQQKIKNTINNINVTMQRFTNQMNVVQDKTRNDKEKLNKLGSIASQLVNRSSYLTQHYETMSWDEMKNCVEWMLMLEDKFVHVSTGNNVANIPDGHPLHGFAVGLTNALCSLLLIVDEKSSQPEEVNKKETSAVQTKPEALDMNIKRLCEADDAKDALQLVASVARETAATLLDMTHAADNTTNSDTHQKLGYSGKELALSTVELMMASMQKVEDSSMKTECLKLAEHTMEKIRNVIIMPLEKIQQESPIENAAEQQPPNTLEESRVMAERMLTLLKVTQQKSEVTQMLDDAVQIIGPVEELLRQLTLAATTVHNQDAANRMKEANVKLNNAVELLRTALKRKAEEMPSDDTGNRSTEQQGEEQCSTGADSSAPHQQQVQPSKKSRVECTKIQRRILEQIFKDYKQPTQEMEIKIADTLGMELSRVENFFVEARTELAKEAEKKT